MLHIMARMRRAFALLSVIAVASLNPIGVPPSAAASCGVWRWDVKTLSDPARGTVNFNARATRIDHLRKLDAPAVTLE